MNRFTKIVVTIALVAMSMTAIAGEVTVKGINGTWWNPEYDGEGLILEQYDDGTFIAYMFTYGGVTSMQHWIMGVGRVGHTDDRIEFDMIETSGGHIGSQDNPTDVEREYWGRLTLDLISCDRIEMYADGGYSEQAQYTLQRIMPHDMLTNAFCEDEYVEQKPEPDFVLYKSGRAYGSYTGSMTMNATVMGSNTVTVATFTIEAVDGDITISRASATGDGQPYITGLSEGEVIREGNSKQFKFISPLTDNQTYQLHYIVEVEGLGRAVDLAVTLRTN